MARRPELIWSDGDGGREKRAAQMTEKTEAGREEYGLWS